MQDTQGAHAERCAQHYLEAQGLELIARNYRCRHGEIDLVMREGSVLVFIEVRLRSNPRYASAAASVDIAKQQRLRRSAQSFLRYRPSEQQQPCRFDVIAYDGDPDTSTGPRWIRQAF